MICIRREATMSKICYESTSTGNDFSVSKSSMAAKGDNTALCGYGADGKRTNGYDHVIIPQPEKEADGAAGTGTSRFCGLALALASKSAMRLDLDPATVCTKSLPFNVRFLSDNGEAEMDNGGTGFRLSYTQSK